MANKQGSKGVEDFASAHGQTSWHGVMTCPACPNADAAG